MKRVKALSISLLIAYLLGMVAFALSGRTLLPVEDASAFEVFSSARFSKWALLTFAHVLAEIGRFFPIGFLVSNLLPNAERWLKRIFVSLVLGIPLSIALAIFVRGFEFGKNWNSPGPSDLFLPVFGCLLGVWVGACWKRGKAARLWLIPKFAVIAITLAVLLVLLAVYGTDVEPLGFASTPVTTTDKQQTWEKIRKARDKTKGDIGANDPEGTRRAENQLTEIHFTEKDLTTLLGMGLAIFPQEAKVRVDVVPGADNAPGGTNAQASVMLPTIRGQKRYFNLIVGSKLQIAPGLFNFRLSGLRLGQMTIPDWALSPLSFITRNFIQYDRRFGPVVKATQRVEVAANDLEIVYREDLAKVQLATLFGGGTSEELVAATKLYIGELLKRAQEVRAAPPDTRFITVMNVAFKFAKERASSHDAVTENKAAILALNMAYGDVAIARFIGDLGDEKAMKALHEQLGPLTIRDHGNWSQNFFLAGALTVTSSEAASNALSALKEELDAKEYRKGSEQMFSFADLLSRKAGSRFAQFATESSKSARALQERASVAFPLEDFYPTPEGLPQDIHLDAELITSAGKVRGKNFDAYEKEIENRLNRSPGYREP